MLKFIIAILLLGVIACNQKQSKADIKILDFGAFTLEAPQSWTKIEQQGIDSYAGRISIGNNDTLDFDLGWYSNDLHEYDPTILDSSMMKDIDTTRVNVNEIIFVKNRMRVDPDKYRKNNVSWDTIAGHNAKIVYPRKSGIGTTGVYIDSLWVKGSDVTKFNLFGENLKPENEKKVLQALRTLKFNNK